MGGMYALMAAARCTGLGAMVGALHSGRSGRTPKLQSAASALVAYGVVLGLFAATDDVAIALLAQLAVGYFYFAVMTSLQTLLQQVVDEGKRGRIMSLFQICWAGLVPFGGLGMGVAAGVFSIEATLIGAALLCAAFGAAMIARVGRAS